MPNERCAIVEHKTQSFTPKERVNDELNGNRNSVFAIRDGVAFILCRGKGAFIPLATVLKETILAE
jgi:hypothetical protein